MPEIVDFETWNQKHLDYEIETNTIVPGIVDFETWNQKHLDYEIETYICQDLKDCEEFLEIKSISITRLKLCTEPGSDSLWSDLKSKASRLRDWNGSWIRCLSWAVCLLEIKSISITRLKQFIGLWWHLVYPSWNQKHLDYEIETNNIETSVEGTTRALEIKSISITRLKLSSRSTASTPATILEIKSISITRLKLSC